MPPIVCLVNWSSVLTRYIFFIQFLLPRFFDECCQNKAALITKTDHTSSLNNVIVTRWRNAISVLVIVLSRINQTLSVHNLILCMPLFTTLTSDWVSYTGEHLVQSKLCRNSFMHILVFRNPPWCSIDKAVQLYIGRHLQKQVTVCTHQARWLTVILLNNNIIQTPKCQNPLSD